MGNLWYKNIEPVADISQKNKVPNGLTFKEVGFQPEFEANKLAVTPPGVVS